MCAHYSYRALHPARFVLVFIFPKNVDGPIASIYRKWMKWSGQAFEQLCQDGLQEETWLWIGPVQELYNNWGEKWIELNLCYSLSKFSFALIVTLKRIKKQRHGEKRIIAFLLGLKLLWMCKQEDLAVCIYIWNRR